MIPVVRLLYNIDFKLNKIATNKHQSIPLEDKIIAVNEGQIKLIKKKLSTNNIYGQGLDSFKKRYDDLENIIEPHILLPVKQDPDSKLNKWVTTLPDASSNHPQYMFYIDAYYLANKGSCTDRVISTNRVKHADIHMMLRNENTSPSFEYQECPITITEDQIEFYTDGTFEPSALYLSYVRYPQKIDYEGYINFDGNPSTTQDCELREYLENELLDLVVQELAFSTENDPAAKYTQARLQNNE